MQTIHRDRHTTEYKTVQQATTAVAVRQELPKSTTQRPQQQAAYKMSPCVLWPWAIIAGGIIADVPRP